MSITEQALFLPFDTITATAIALAILPVLSFVLLLFWKESLPDAGKVGTFFTGVAFCLAVYIFLNTWGSDPHHARFSWFGIGDAIQFTIGIRVDSITAMMVVVVTLVSMLVQLFSTAYMRHEQHYSRYFAYLGLFTFSMIGIVLADNLLLLFVFWELVGFSSYLLIGFWFHKDSAAIAAKKAFVINRIGDAGFLAAIFAIWSLFGSLDITLLTNAVTADPSILVNNHYLLLIAGIGLFMACVGKSAQFPLQIWLPDAMEGPTPVSALIHAATMVAAGIYLMARVFFLLPSEVLTIIAVIGAITAFIGAFSALYQNDLKKVLAFSTISQLGYMVLAVGVGNYKIALFHLLTHAFFKACLFLTAGSVIDALHHLEHRLQQWGHHIHFDAQDMRWMGGLRKVMPVTFTCYTIAMLSLAGLPLFSGFLSKDAILVAAWDWAAAKGSWTYLIPAIGFLSALLTAFYMGRQWFMVFWGQFRLEAYLDKQVNFLHPERVALQGAESQPKNFSNLINQVHEAPVAMKIPLVILAGLSFFFIFSINPLDATHGWFLSSMGIEEHSSASSSHTYVAIISVIMATVGLFLAYARFGKTSKEDATVGPFKRVSQNSFYLDDISKLVIGNFILTLSAIAHYLDQKVIDSFIEKVAKAQVLFAHITAFFDRSVVDGLVNLAVWVAGLTGKITRSFQGGRVQYHIFWAVLGLVLLVVLFVF